MLAKGSIRTIRPSRNVATPRSAQCRYLLELNFSGEAWAEAIYGAAQD